MDRRSEVKIWAGAIVAFAVAMGILVAVGVALNADSEPTFLESAILWERDSFPLGVCGSSYGADELLEEHRSSLEHAIDVTNARIGFPVFVATAARCDVRATFGAPVEPGWRDPGGDARWAGTFPPCEIATANVHGEVQTLVIQHELGHCLGLDHDSFERSIMRPTQSETPDRALPPWFSDVDREAVRRRYGP